MNLQRIMQYFSDLIGYDANVAPQEFDMDKWREYCYSQSGKGVRIVQIAIKGRLLVDILEPVFKRMKNEHMIKYPQSYRISFMENPEFLI